MPFVLGSDSRRPRDVEIGERVLQLVRLVSECGQAHRRTPSEALPRSSAPRGASWSSSSSPTRLVVDIRDPVARGFPIDDLVPTTVADAIRRLGSRGARVETGTVVDEDAERPT